MTNAVRGTKKPKGKAKPEASKGPMPKGKLKHLSVMPADNGGYTVQSEHEAPVAKAAKGLSAYGPDSKGHTAVFANHQDAMSHIGALMGPGESPSPSRVTVGSDDDAE